MTETEAARAIIKVCREIKGLLREIRRKLNQTQQAVEEGGEVSDSVLDDENLVRHASEDVIATLNRIGSDVERLGHLLNLIRVCRKPYDSTWDVRPLINNLKTVERRLKAGKSNT